MRKSFGRGVFQQIGLCCLLFFLFVSNIHAQQLSSARELKKLSLEQLFKLEVTTASRKPEPLSRASSAIDVLTQERIQRSGATNMPDVLRLASGLNVARFDGRSWAISARGLNLNTSNKLQVMMDGRSLYTPLFSGVFWDVQDYILEDIDRIEVVRGPGATLWGANAVNGVINILTKSAADTQGTLIEGGAGDEERGFVNARYGGKAKDAGFYRGYFRFFSRDGLVFANGQDAKDDWQMGRGGFRFDSNQDGSDSYTIQGDIYRGALGLNDRADTDVSGGNVLGRWKRRFSPDSQLQVQLYYDRSARKVPLQFQESRNTFDIDLQHRLQFAGRNDLVWGVDYRASADQTEDIGTVQFDPKDRTIHLISAFIQDEITVLPEKLHVIAGSKFEDNTFTNLEVQPNLRVAYTPNDNQTAWGSIARAVRVPTRIDTDFRFFPVPGFLAIVGNPDFKPEELIAYEGGYRIQPYEKIYLDATAFYDNYDSLITVRPQGPGLPGMLSNDANANVYGVTVASRIYPTNKLRFIGSISFLHKDIDLDPGTIDLTSLTGEGNDAGHFWSVQTMIDPTPKFQIDFILRSSGELPSPFVPAYTTADFRLAWEPVKYLELSIAGQNLFQKSHPEFGSDTPFRKEVERSVYGRASWSF